MKIKVYVVDLEVPPALKRRALKLAILAAMIGGVATIAVAAAPKTDWKPDDVLKADDLNNSFKSLDTRLAAAETTLANQQVHVATNCTNSGGATTCTCPSGEIAISAGILPTTSSGIGYTVESRNISGPGATWQTICKSESGAPIVCEVSQVFCLRLK